MYGGTVDQQRDYATAYAQLHPGEPVRFTVVTRGFFGDIKHHVEEVTGAQDGTVRLLKVGPDGKPFTAINSSTFTSVLNK